MPKVIEYKCPNCGAPMTFDSATQKMSCASCGTQMDMEAFRQYDEALKSAENHPAASWDEYHPKSEWNAEEQGKMTAHVCASCGGELIMDETTVASECPYCGNTVVVPRQVSDMLRPDMIIPFKLDKNAAKEALYKFYKKKPLLPKFFKENNRIDKITGMYVPYWLYDCDTSSAGVYNATRVSTWETGDTRYTKTDFYLVTRSGNLSFEKIPADGSVKMDDDMMESIEPFDYTQTEPFSMAYLSGYLADKYDVDAEANKPRVNERIRQSVDREFRRTISGYAAVTNSSLNVNIHNGQIHYALFPIWMLNTKYNKNLYSFAMNAQTGKLAGDLPISAGKAAATLGGVFVGSAILLTVAAFAFGMSPEFASFLQIASLAAAVFAGITYIPFLSKKKGTVKS